MDLVVVELIRDGKVKLSYAMTVESDDGDHVVVEGQYAEPVDRDLGYVTLQTTDRFREHYWRTRWYSIKDVRDANGHRKGWYCDITRPVEVVGTRLRSVDLDLDLWVSADLDVVLELDEDEFIQSGIERSDPDSASRARDTLALLLAAANNGTQEWLKTHTDLAGDVA
jgi:protein associated with RNAse G/E